MPDRFKLEDAIQAAWQTENDLELFVEQYYDGSKIMSQDDVANVLLGLKELHNLRMNKLWDTFIKTYKLDDRAEKMERFSEVNQEIEEALKQPEQEAIKHAYFDGVKSGIKAERERCAKIALSGTGEPVQVATLEILRKERERIAAAIMEIEK